jgi:hypothetical protein
MPGARRTRSLACKTKQTRKQSHYRFAENTRHSLRNGFNGCSALSPGFGLVSPRR